MATDNDLTDTVRNAFLDSDGESKY